MRIRLARSRFVTKGALASTLAAAVVVGALVAPLGACIDPVHQDQIDALGPEKSSVRPGPEHRPGQPCLVCHGSSGPASPQFSVAGTVYAVKGDSTPLEGATVQITDADGNEHDATTNGAGNFYIQTAQWEPKAPFHVVVVSGANTATMNTHVGRDGSCATCHTDTEGPRSAGPVYLVIDSADLDAGATE